MMSTFGPHRLPPGLGFHDARCFDCLFDTDTDTADTMSSTTAAMLDNPVVTMSLPPSLSADLRSRIDGSRVASTSTDAATSSVVGDGMPEGGKQCGFESTVHTATTPTTECGLHRDSDT